VFERLWRLYSGRAGREGMGSSSDEEELDESLFAPCGDAERERSSIDASSDGVSCEDGLRSMGSVWVVDASWAGSAVLSALLFCNDRRVGRLGVDLDWKPVGTGLPLLCGGIVCRSAAALVSRSHNLGRRYLNTENRVLHAAGDASPSHPRSLGTWSTLPLYITDHHYKR